jgi:6,7-dimethyl-8-ribityllumazine synthase
VLRRIKKTKAAQASGGHFAIIASRYNSRFVDGMLTAAERTLAAAGADSVRVIRVPGAFEIPVAAARLIRSAAHPLDAVICLGVILRGQTAHAQHIGEAVSQALMQLQIEKGIPIIHEVLLLENTQQAEVRCLSPEHNRGAEAAQTALEMKRIIDGLK